MGQNALKAFLEYPAFRWNRLDALSFYCRISFFAKPVPTFARYALGLILFTVLFANISRAEGVNAWSDKATGYAIAGYDPLSYFTLGKATLGHSKFEYVWNGTVWKFQNEGNRDAFMRHPEVYAPHFAGYDPYALAKGYPVEGLPTVWRIWENRLYFFHNVVNKHLWAEDPQDYEMKAKENWQRIRLSIPNFDKAYWFK